MSQISNALMNAHRAKMRGLEKKNRYKREREQDTLNKILFAFKTRETVASALDTVATKRLEVSPSKQFSEYLKPKDPNLYDSLIMLHPKCTLGIHLYDKHTICMLFCLG